MSKALPINATIGIIGGGQLGRMAAMAAARLGFRVHIFTPEENSPAAQVSADVTVADYSDRDALTRFAESVDVVTFEFENIPADSVRLLAEKVAVRPGWNVLETAQDRIAEKSFFNGLSIETAPWREVTGPESLAAAVAALGRPSVLKTTRLGYDGKGQVKIAKGADLTEAWGQLGTDVAILEGFIDFRIEVSVMVARGLDGQMQSYVPVENRHVNHILSETRAPAPIAADLARKAEEIAQRAAAALNLVGLLGVEMFITRDERILVNEMAPRPHNSGHWTMDACYCDQFEQLIRAVSGLPLGSPERHSDAVMLNLIGDDVEKRLGWLADPHARLHLYGKAEARPGRKMGHVNRLLPKSA